VDAEAKFYRLALVIALFVFVVTFSFAFAMSLAVPLWERGARKECRRKDASDAVPQKT